MPTLWDDFVENYKDELPNWSLLFTLEAFWHFCYSGDKACDGFLSRNKKE